MTVEHERLSLDVVKIQLNAIRPRQVVSSPHLRKPREPRPDEKSTALARASSTLAAVSPSALKTRNCKSG